MSVDIETVTLAELVRSLEQRCMETKKNYQQTKSLGGSIEAIKVAYREWANVDDSFHDVLRIIKKTNELLLD